MSKSLRFVVLLLLTVTSIPVTVAVNPTVVAAASDDFTLSGAQLSEFLDACQGSDLQPRLGDGRVVQPGEDRKPRTEQRVFTCWWLKKTTMCTQNPVNADSYDCTVDLRVEAERVSVDSLSDLGCDLSAFYWNDPVLTCTDYTNWTADCYPVSDYFVCVMYRPQGDIRDSVVAIYPDWTAGPKPFLPIFW